VIVGCSTSPTPTEQRWFQIQTNQVPEITITTNVVTVTLTRTNYVTVTNTQGVVEYQTNIVPVFVPQTNVVVVARTNETYLYSPGPGSQLIQETGGMVGNLFGVGGIVSSAIAALFGIWAQVRSSRRYTTAATLAQTIEVIREFIKSLPNGAVVDAAFVKWMQDRQIETTTLQQVLKLLETEVSSDEAKKNLKTIMMMVEAIQSQTPPPLSPPKNPQTPA